MTPSEASTYASFDRTASIGWSAIPNLVCPPVPEQHGKLHSGFFIFGKTSQVRQRGMQDDEITLSQTCSVIHYVDN